MTVKKTRNDGEWTEARYNSFIKGALRQASNRWPPKYRVKKAAWVERGVYKCVGYKRKAHQVPLSRYENGNRKNNVTVDHIVPIIDPNKGFETWDKVIKHMFCEAEGLQVLCHQCHKLKTNEERIKRK